MRKALKTSPIRPISLIKTVCTIPQYHWLANQFNEYCHANNHPFLINLDRLTFGGIS